MVTLFYFPFCNTTLEIAFIGVLVLCWNLFDQSYLQQKVSFRSHLSHLTLMSFLTLCYTEKCWVLFCFKSVKYHSNLKFKKAVKHFLSLVFIFFTHFIYNIVNIFCFYIKHILLYFVEGLRNNTWNYVKFTFQYKTFSKVFYYASFPGFGNMAQVNDMIEKTKTRTKNRLLVPIPHLPNL